MASFRISRPAQRDLELILATSEERWGVRTRSRYASLLAAALRIIAAEPQGTATRDRGELLSGLRSFHLRHVASRGAVARPVHVVYFRVTRTRVVDIIRVLHERMDPQAHLDEPAPPVPRRGRRGGH